ncbi:MAG: hemin uptake protein HemP [Gammaproteobacteria bacterium]|nr:hemin uptake protein HemP [Gammaproteobacteria bacterium]
MQSPAGLPPTAALFRRGATRIHIQHAGKTYILQITRQGKLILTR